MKAPPKEGNIDNQVQSENWLVSKFKFIVKHYLILSALPLIFGGIVQLLGLGGVGLHYLRFFSTSQLLIDGVIMLIIIVVILALSFVAYLFLETYNLRCYIKYEPEFIEDKSTYKKIKIKGDYNRLIFINIIAIVIILIGLIRNGEVLIELFKSIFNGSFSQFDLPLRLAILFCFSIFVIVGNINVYYRKKGTNEQMDTLSMLAYCGLIFFLGPQLFQMKIPKIAKLEYVGNYQNHKNKLLNTYPNYKNTDILYYNDKFIFTELSSSDDKTIIITKMDDFIELK